MGELKNEELGVRNLENQPLFWQDLQLVPLSPFRYTGGIKNRNGGVVMK
jgi:hypothetical protein